MDVVPLRRLLNHASYKVALQCAHTKVPRTMAEKLVKPCAIKWMNWFLERMLPEILPMYRSPTMSLVQGLWKCSLMCWTIIMSIKASPCRVSLQVDKSIDVGNMGQRIIFVRFVKAGLFADEFLCCHSLSLRTRAADIFKLIDAFFQDHSISWDKVGSLCTDGAPAMMRHRSGFTALVKQRTPYVNTSQCILHCHALTTRTLLIVFKIVLDTTVRAVNFIIGSSMNQTIQSILQRDGTEHQVMLFHT